MTIETNDHEVRAALPSDEPTDCPRHGCFHHAFLSYRRNDGEDLACHVAEALSARGVDVFWDQHCLGPGRYACCLTRFDERAAVFLPLLTPNYINGVSSDEGVDYCIRELETALNSSKVIIPIIKGSPKDAYSQRAVADRYEGLFNQLLARNLCCIESASFAEDMDRLAAWIKSSAGGLSGEIEDGRRFKNNLSDYDPSTREVARNLSAHVHERIDNAISTLVVDICQKIGPIAPASDPRFDCPDFSLYAGVGGMALALWVAAEYLDRVEADAGLTAICKEGSRRALECALKLAGEERNNRVFSFYCGAPGVHALATMIHGATDSALALEHTQYVLGLIDRAVADPEAELLYGRAGYLYSLLVLRRHLAPAKQPAQFTQSLNRVFDEIVADGIRLGAKLVKEFPRESLTQSPLAYRFPADSGAVYFGAAHGLAGVLYVLLHLPEKCLAAPVRGAVRGAVDFLLSIQDSDGNFPVAIEEPGTELVHWCHGAPGIIPTLCKAYEVYGEIIYLQAARHAADSVWRRGFLRKGLGVCHGISGSALCQLTLYRTTGDRRYLYRAMRMSEATWFEPCLRIIGQTPDIHRFRPGTPDYPYSLMEGKSGLLYAYVAMQCPERSSFPGYDGAT